MEVATAPIEAWEAALVSVGIAPADAEILSQSECDAGRRVYRVGDRALKVVLKALQQTEHRRSLTLEDEARLLRRWTALAGCFGAVRFEETDLCQCLIFDYVPGRPLSDLRLGRADKLIVTARLAGLLTRLSAAGIAHRDVLPRNILVDRRDVVLVDFDQALETTRLEALLSNFLGEGRFGPPAHGSLLAVVDVLTRSRWPGRLLGWNHALQRTLRARRSARQVPRLGRRASPHLRLLRRAWLLGQRSDANAPEGAVCYYSLTTEGQHFPGERPWEQRWEALRAAADCNGKRILELGCNLGLLSTFLLAKGGARAALAVDADALILEGAQLVGEAYGVTPDLLQVDLDHVACFEAELLAFRPDVVFALNVLNWVRDKERLLRFLGSCPEVVFEGHEGAEIEEERLRGVGFARIRRVGTSERGRTILHCRRE